MKKAILLLAFILINFFQVLMITLPSEVFALDEEELLTDFTKATSYTYSSVRYTASYYTFETDVDTAHQKLMLYKGIKGFEWGCSEPECHGDFVEALRQCDVNLLYADMNLWALRIIGDNTDMVNDTHNYLDEANVQLIKAYIAWEEYLTPTFHEQSYLSRNSDVARAVKQGLIGTGWEHYQACGMKEGRSYASPDLYADFNEEYYLANNSDVARAVEQGFLGTGWEHYQACGMYEGRNYIKPEYYLNFSERYYLANNADVARAVKQGLIGTGWEHYKTWGANEGRSYAKPGNYGNFTEVYYLSRNPDVAKAVEQGQIGTGWEHYQACGMKEGRNYIKPNDYQGVAHGGW